MMRAGPLKDLFSLCARLVVSLVFDPFDYKLGEMRDLFQ